MMNKIQICLLAVLISFKLSAQVKDINTKPLTPQKLSERLLPQYKALAFLPIKPVSLADIIDGRKKEAEKPIPKLTNEDSITVTYTKIPGLNSGDPEIPVRIYKSKNIPKGPIYLMFHGGGFVSGNLNWDHQRAANIAQNTGAVVISVDYRLAPENPFPAALNDGYAALLWSVKHAAEFGGDTAHIAVAGGSAGAGLAGGIAWKARDENGPKITVQVLEIPPGDMDTTYISTREFYNIPGLKGADVMPLLKMYVPQVANGQPLPKYVLPGLIDDVHGLPITMVVTCGVDPLRDGGLAYGIRLIQAGIKTELLSYPGLAHGMGIPGYDEQLYRFINQFLK